MEIHAFVGPQEYQWTKLHWEESTFASFDLNKRLKPSVLGNPQYEDVYGGYEEFSCLPANVFEAVYNSDEHVFISAMKKSGKTTAAEFAILRECNKSSFLVVYLTPSEALAKKRFYKWQTKFASLGFVQVAQVTNDVSDVDFDFQNLLIATPKKWDVVSRWLKEKDFERVSLVIIDELHMLDPLYELVISRFKKYALRLVGFSSLILNSNEIGAWIGASHLMIFNFPPAARRVPLEVYIQGIDLSYLDCKESIFSAFTKATYRTICGNVNSTIIYVPTKHVVHLMAFELIGFDLMRNRQGKTCFVLRSWDNLKQRLVCVKDFRLRICLRCGVGFLHDELVESDRNLVRELFDEGFIQVCVVIASLCWVEPILAHVVLVVGQQSDEFEWIEMVGHAIKGTVAKCFFLNNVKAPIDKHLKLKGLEVKSNMPNYDHHHHINSLIAARQIRKEEDLKRYIQATFYYTCVSIHPELSLLKVLYGFRKHIEKVMSDLVDSHCVEIGNGRISPLPSCILTSRFYITYPTFHCLFPMLSRTTTVLDLLKVVTSGHEFSYFAVRVGESKVLQKMIRKRKYSYGKLKYNDPHGKAFVLLQAHLSRHPIDGSLLGDQHEVVSSTIRLLEATLQYIIHCQSLLGLGIQVIELMQMIKQGTWGHDSQYMQLERAMNAYPNIVVTCEVQAARGGRNEVILVITIAKLSTFTSHGWWVFVGDKEDNSILTSKIVFLHEEYTKMELHFVAPSVSMGIAKFYTLFIKSNTYVGSDKEFDFSI